MIFLKAFLVGGAICAIVQIFIDKTKLTPGRIMVSLVCIGVLLGAVGVYEPFAKWAGCGATVSSFGVWKYIVERYEGSDNGVGSSWLV